MKNNKIICFLLILLVLFIILAINLDTKLEITHYTLESIRIPSDLDGFKIVQISDLHNARFGTNQIELVEAIKSCSPDLIVITGDTFNKTDSNFDNVRQLITQISTIAPIYSVAGNHEYLNYGLYMQLLDFYKAVNVTELTDEQAKIAIGNTNLIIYGINQEHCHELEQNDISELNIPMLKENDFGIILYHFANQFDALAPAVQDYFCVFSGHTHGGIIRLPFIGGLIANDRTVFPLYSGGLYSKDNLYLISSRGLGDSFLPRFNNNPELVCVTLKCQNN